MFLALAALCVALLLGFAALQTAAGKRWLAGVIEARATGPPAERIRLGDISGIVPFNLQLSSLRIWNDGAEWLAADNIAVQIAVWPLFRGRLQVLNASADRIALNALPESESGGEAQPWKLPEIPDMPRWLHIDRFAVGELSVSESVLPESASFSIEGHFIPELSGRNVEIEAALARLDAPTTTAACMLLLSDDALTIQADVSDTVYIPRMLGVDDAFTFKLDGSGPLTQWDASLSAELGDDTLAESTATLRADNDTRFRSEGIVNLIPALIPESVRQRVGDQLNFAATGFLTRSGALSVDSIGINSKTARLQGHGTTHLERKTLSASIGVEHDDLRSFVQSAAPDPLEGTLDVEIGGTWSAQHWTIAGAAGEETFARLDADAVFEQIVKLAVSGELSVPKLLVPEEHRELAQDPVAVAIDASYDQSNGTWDIPEFHLGNQRASATGALRAYPADNLLAADAQLRLTDSTWLNNLLPVDIEGTGSGGLQINGSSSGTTGSLRFELSGLQINDIQVPTVSAEASVQAGSWPDNLLHGVSLELDARTSPWSAKEYDFDGLTLAAVVEQDRDGPIRITRAELTDGHLSVTARGSVAADLTEADIAADLQNADLGRYARIADLPYGGIVTAQADATLDAAREAPWRGTLRAVLQDPAGLPGPAIDFLGPLVELETDVDYNDRTVAITRLKANAQDWQLDGKGTLHPAKRSFDADARLELDAATIQNVRLGGALVFAANGTADEFEANAEARLNELRSGDIQIDVLNGAVLASGSFERVDASAQLTAETNGESIDLTAAAELSPERIRVPELALRSEQNRIDGNAVWAVEEQRGEGRVTLDMPDLSPIGRIVGLTLTGRVAGDIELAAAGDDAKLDVNVSVNGLDTDFARAEEARLDGSVINPFRNRSGQLRMTAAAFEAFAFQADAMHLAADIDPERVALTGNTDGLFRNEIPFKVATRINWLADESAIELAVFEGELETYPFALSAPARLQFEEGETTLHPLELTFASGAIAASGASGQSGIAADLRLSGLPLEAGRLVRMPFSEGSIDGTITLSGTAEQPEAQVTLDIRNAKTPVMAEIQDLVANVHIESSFTPAEIDLQTTLDLPQQAHAELAALLPLTYTRGRGYAIDRSAALSASLTSDARLAVLPRLLALDRHVLEGRLTTNFELAGTYTNPRLSGRAHIESGRYENADLGTVLTNLETDIVASGDRIELDRFAADDPAGGSIAATGSIAFSDMATFEHTLETQLNSARLVHRDDFTGRISGELKIAGNQDEGEATGSIEVNEADVILRPSPARSIPELDVTLANAPPSVQAQYETETGPSNAPGYPVALDIGVELPGRVFVQAQDVFTEWQGALQIGGSLSDPQITGEIQPVRGHVSFLGRRFTIQDESIMSIDTQQSLSPHLNLRAITERNNLTATLTIRGPLEKLSIDMTSTPPLPREEILSHVLFGRNMSEISPVQALQLARAVAMLSGTFEGVPFFSGPSRLPVIDTFDVETGGESGPTVSVGKYLSDSIFVEIEQGASAETSEANVEFEVTPHISFESSLGADAQGGLGLFWKYDY